MVEGGRDGRCYGGADCGKVEERKRVNKGEMAGVREGRNEGGGREIKRRERGREGGSKGRK